MGAFTKIPSDTFQGLQVDAGVLLTSFNPASPAVVDSAIITATTGGITVSAVASYEDLGEDVPLILRQADAAQAAANVKIGDVQKFHGNLRMPA